MSLFQFISSHFPEAFEAAQDAEENVHKKPVTSAIYARQAMEFMLNWMYEYDDDLYLQPYENTLAAKIRANCFQRLPQKVRDELELIRRIGNNANHRRKASSNEAILAMKALFHFFQYTATTYTKEEVPSKFLLPRKKGRVSTTKVGEVDKLNITFDKALQHQQELFEQQLKEKEAQVNAFKEELAALKVTNANKQIPPSEISESETRRTFIDTDLISLKWELIPKTTTEYEVDNMPKHINPTGKGYIDYVLWGDDGLPLAVIEAKRTMVDVQKGKSQAVAYADALEKKFDRRPIILYSNGFETYLWDDAFYPPRRVFGFLNKNELQLMMDRRSTRKDIRQQDINIHITGRPYQIEAIQRVMETFAGNNIEGRLTGNKRKALLVMATGTGKTRTAISLVDLLMRCNWVKRVLFLADRNALVTQAKGAFNEHLPHLSAIDLTKEHEEIGTRLVLSTYPTMLNRIDESRVDGGRIYSPGHFDLIIIDEAHRSIYNRYADIFQYFDALQVGLTATPREDTHRDTYEAFECDEGNPTFYYELEQAIKDNYLVPFEQQIMSTGFLKRGIEYAKLSAEEKEKLDEAFAEQGLEAPEFVDSKAINKWLMNKDTVIKVLDELMSNGIKVNNGNIIGKTIIFARNQNHAQYILNVFDEQYPEYRGKIAKVVTYLEGKYAQDSIDKFKTPDSGMQIAISVDMLDTGIDVPEIVNLVFFRDVYSHVKFWQMIGRGTRLSEDLFAPGDKEKFVIFDWCENFKYFGENPKGRQEDTSKSLNHIIFENRLEIAQALQFTEDKDLSDFRKVQLDLCHNLVAQLYANKNAARVKLRLELVTRFKDRINWDNISDVDKSLLIQDLGPIIFIEDADEQAKRFDALMFQMMMALLSMGSIPENRQTKVQQASTMLSRKESIPQIKERITYLKAVANDEFWKEIDIIGMENVRLGLRGLMKFLDKHYQPIITTNIIDTVLAGPAAEPTSNPLSANYFEKVRRLLIEYKDHLVIQKVRSNQVITELELEQLEQMLFNDIDLKIDILEEEGLSLVSFIKSILGLDNQVANAAFAKYLNNANLNADQIAFVREIVANFCNNGRVDPNMLFESQPYTTYHTSGIGGLFNETESKEIVGIVKELNVG